MHDLLEAASPLDVARILHEAADKYQSDAVELQAAWQDPQAGKIWIGIAQRFERMADAIEKDWAKL